MKNSYFPLIKTRTAEERAIISIAPFVKNDIVPVFELTKPRKTKNYPDGKSLLEKLEKLLRDYGETSIGLDLTSHTNLRNNEISSLFSNKKKFKKWIDFISSCNNSFENIIHPTYLISDEGLIDNEGEVITDKFDDIHRSEVQSLSSFRDNIIFRFPFRYQSYMYHLENIFKQLQSPPIVILDLEYIRKNKRNEYINGTKLILKDLFEWNPRMIVVLASGSFPKDPTENGSDETGENILEEVYVYEECKKEFPKLIYGDYASVHPRPNEQAGGGGWIPRIDIPARKSIFYVRSRKKDSEKNYAGAYIRTAQKAVKHHAYKQLQNWVGRDNWGIQQIQAAADGAPAGLSPSFWISVRINLHITLQTLIRTGKV